MNGQTQKWATYCFLMLAIFTVPKFVKCEDATPQAKPLIPLKIGNVWTYSATREDKEKNETRTFEVTNRVVATRLIQRNGKWETWHNLREFEVYYWCKNDPKGIVEAFVDYHADELREEIKDGEAWEILPTIDEELIYLAHPTTVGKKWKLWDGDEGEPPTTMELVAKDVKITSKAGEFSCLHYRMRYAGGMDDYFITPGVGIIKFTVKDDVENTEYLLKSWQPAK